MARGPPFPADSMASFMIFHLQITIEDVIVVLPQFIPQVATQVLTTHADRLIGCTKSTIGTLLYVSFPR